VRGLIPTIARLAAPVFVFAAVLSLPAMALAQQPFKCSKTPYVDHNGRFEGGDKEGSISGSPVIVICDDTQIYANKISWNETTVFATGDVLVVQPGLRVNASRIEIDRATKMGTFFDAFGTARLSDNEAQRTMFGGMEPEIMFQGEKIERIGPKSYKLTNGMFSTCVQATPRWQLTSGTASIILDDRFTMKNAALKVKGVPVMFLPYMYYPLDRDNRKTGFLMPSYTSSAVRGQSFSNAFFLVLGRSHDATFYYDFASKGYQGAGTEYRYALAGGSGNAYYYLSDEDDRIAPDGTVERAGRRSFEVRGDLNQALPRGFRMYGNVNYRSDVTTQQLYQQNVYEQTRRDRNLSFGVDGNITQRLRMSATARQQDIYNGTVISRNGTLPRVNLWLSGKGLRDQGFLQKVYFGASGQAAYLEARPNLDQPASDRSLWRFDATPEVSAPLSPVGWMDASARASWRITNWQETIDPLTNTPVPVALTRNLFNFHADVIGPKFEKIVATPNNRYAEKFKHLIEPRTSFDYLSPFNELNRVIKIDPGVDSLVGGTTSISYALFNRFFAKVKTPEGVIDREILSVGLSQTWYSNAQAGAIDPNYPSPTINTYSAVNFRVATQPIDDIDGWFQMYLDPTTKKVSSYSAGGRLSPHGGRRFEVAATWSKRPFRLLDPNFNNPNNSSHFINGETTMRFLQNRVEGTYGFNYDIKNGALLQQRIRGSYATQCCGFAMEYQAQNIAQYGFQGVPRDRRLTVTFSLGGIGSFVTPLGAFGR